MFDYHKYDCEEDAKSIRDKRPNVKLSVDLSVRYSRKSYLYNQLIISSFYSIVLRLNSMLSIPTIKDVGKLA